MRENSVDKILTSLPSYSSATGQGGIVENANKLTFHVRNTIPWSLVCELELDQDRNFGLE